MVSDAPDPAAAIAAFVAGFDGQSLPSDAVRVVERGFTDTAGTVLAGCTVGVGRTVTHLGSAVSGQGGARVLGCGDEVPVPTAAFVNATAGRVHDYDDYAQAIIAHPSVVLVPTILAVSDARGYGE